MKTLFCEIMAPKTSEAETHLQKQRTLLPLLADCMKQAGVSGQKKRQGLITSVFSWRKSNVRRERGKLKLRLWDSRGSQPPKHLTKSREYCQTIPIPPPLNLVCQSFRKINFFGIVPSFSSLSAIQPAARYITTLPTGFVLLYSTRTWAIFTACSLMCLIYNIPISKTAF